MTTGPPVCLLLADPPRVAAPRPIEVDRVERHAGPVAALAEGRLSSDDFAQEAGALLPLAGGLRLLADPAATLLSELGIRGQGPRPRVLGSRKRAARTQLGH